MYHKTKPTLYKKKKKKPTLKKKKKNMSLKVVVCITTIIQ